MKIWKRRAALVLALVLLLSTGAMAAGAKYSSCSRHIIRKCRRLAFSPPPSQPVI